MYGPLITNRSSSDIKKKSEKFYGIPNDKHEGYNSDENFHYKNIRKI